MSPEEGPRTRQPLHGAFGVMFDDLIAASYALLVLAVAKTIMDGVT